MCLIVISVTKSDGDDGVEIISFLQNYNKMKIKMNGVNHVESPIITAVHSLLIL